MTCKLTFRSQNRFLYLKSVYLYISTQFIIYLLVCIWKWMYYPQKVSYGSVTLFLWEKVQVHINWIKLRFWCQILNFHVAYLLFMMFFNDSRLLQKKCALRWWEMFVLPYCVTYIAGFTSLHTSLDVVLHTLFWGMVRMEWIHQHLLRHSIPW